MSGFCFFKCFFGSVFFTTTLAAVLFFCDKSLSMLKPICAKLSIQYIQFIFIRKMSGTRFL